MKLRSILAGNLRIWRERRRLSQEALAHDAGIDRSYVSLLENQKYSASLDMIEKLAKALKVEPLALFQPLAAVGATKRKGRS